MDFGEKFRAKHSDLIGLMSKSELDKYAEKIKSRINETNFDKEHDAVSIENSTLTQKQIDYLQLKLNVYMDRSNSDKVEVHPLKPGNVNVGYNFWEIFLTAFIVGTLMIFPLYSLSKFLLSSTTSYVLLLFEGLWVTLLMIGITVLIVYLILHVIQRIRNKKYIKVLQENNEI